MQERFCHDASADATLEYCIKMIANNKLNEQEFEGQSDEDSFEESSEYSSEQREVSGLVQQQSLKSSMKAWYGQFAVKNLTGFKHNSVVYKTE